MGMTDHHALLELPASYQLKRVADFCHPAGCWRRHRSATQSKYSSGTGCFVGQRWAGAGVEGQVDVLAGGLGCYPFCWMNHCCACWPTPWSRPAVQDQVLRKRVGSFKFQVSMSWPLTGRVMMRPNPRTRR
jgi:hypothetical protein